MPFYTNKFFYFCICTGLDSKMRLEQKIQVLIFILYSRKPHFAWLLFARLRYKSSRSHLVILFQDHTSTPEPSLIQLWTVWDSLCQFGIVWFYSCQFWTIHVLLLGNILVIQMRADARTLTVHLLQLGSLSLDMVYTLLLSHRTSLVCTMQRIIYDL